MRTNSYFQSEEFVNIVKPLKSIMNKNSTNDNIELIDHLISASIKYSILFSEEIDSSNEGQKEFLEKVVKNMIENDSEGYFEKSEKCKDYVTKLAFETLLSRLNLTRESLKDERVKEKLGKAIIHKLRGTEYIYHAFNSAFFDSIKENGINPNINFTPQQEIDEIDKIFSNHDIGMICGWKKLNGENEVSYSTTPTVSYYYGMNSPEWFSQFTGQGFAYAPIEKYKKTAFLEGDYEAAKQNLQTLMKETEFSDDEAKKVMDFLDKYWRIYANRKPILAVIPQKTSDEQLEQWDREMLRDSLFENDTERLFKFCFYQVDEHADCQTSETIDTSNAMYINLPTYSELIKRINRVQNIELKEKEQEEEER